MEKLNSLARSLVLTTLFSSLLLVPTYADEIFSGNVKELTLQKFAAVDQDGKWEKGKQVLEKVSSCFDTDHHLVSGIIYNNDDTINTKITYMLDAQGNVKRVNTYNADGSDQTETYYWRDPEGEGKLTGIEEFGPYGDRYFETAVTYDDAGKHYTTIYYSLAGKFDSKEIVDFDANDNAIRQIIYKTLDANEKPSQTTVYEYDSKGCLTSLMQEGTADEVTRIEFTYEYDDQGNWITRMAWKVVTKDGDLTKTPITIESRTYIYYP